MKRIFLTGLCLLFLFCFFACSNGKEKTPESPATPAGITAFLSSDSQYGQVVSLEQMADWAQGNRYRIRTNNASFIFYLKGTEVVGVDRFRPEGGTEKIFQKETPLYTENISRPAEPTMPAYRILFRVALANGSGDMADVLITSLSKQTPVADREKIVRAIAKKEGLVMVALYCTEEAQKANDSASYSKAHPGALAKGYLGMLQGGVFKGN